MNNKAFIARARMLAVASLIACGPVQLYLDSGFENAVCVLATIVVSAFTLVYVLDVSRFRRGPISSLMVLGFNVSVFSGALLIQTLGQRPLTYNLSSALSTFSCLVATQALILVLHAVYSRSRSMTALRGTLTRSLFRPLGLLVPPGNLQLWVCGFTGCAATVLAASSYTDAIEFGDASSKFALAYAPFAVAPFFIPLRPYLFGEPASRSKSTWLISLYAVLLVIIAMANNARGTFAAGFLTLILSCLVAVCGGALVMTRRKVVRGVLITMLALPLFWTMSDLATAMVIARDQRSNVSPTELIDITLNNFFNKAAIADRRQRDEAILNGEYNENYIENPLFARFIYTKFVDVNMANAESLTEDQADEIRSGAWRRILSLLPTPILRYFQIGLDKSDLAYSSGDIYSFIARGLELGSFTTGSEVPDGLTIFGPFFWPVLAFLVLLQFIAYDSLCFVARDGRLVVSASVLLAIVPIFTTGVMQESVAAQVITVVRGIPQLIFLYLLVTLPINLLVRLAPAGLFTARRSHVVTRESASC